MRTKLTITLTDAQTIAAAAQAYAESRQLKVSIAIVDESTHLQHLLRMDGAPYSERQARRRRHAPQRRPGCRPRSSKNR